jgi:hypothetical protein
MGISNPITIASEKIKKIDGGGANYEAQMEQVNLMAQQMNSSTEESPVSLGDWLRGTGGETPPELAGEAARATFAGAALRWLSAPSCSMAWQHHPAS